MEMFGGGKNYLFLNNTLNKSLNLIGLISSTIFHIIEQCSLRQDILSTPVFLTAKWKHDNPSFTGLCKRLNDRIHAQHLISWDWRSSQQIVTIAQKFLNAGFLLSAVKPGRDFVKIHMNGLIEYLALENEVPNWKLQVPRHYSSSQT